MSHVMQQGTAIIGLDKSFLVVHFQAIIKTNAE